MDRIFVPLSSSFIEIFISVGKLDPYYEGCHSYFSITLTKHHNQGNLQKKEFYWETLL